MVFIDLEKTCDNSTKKNLLEGVEEKWNAC